MQLDFLQDDTIAPPEKPIAQKKIKRPERHFPVIEQKVATPEEPLPKLPDSLLASLIVDDISYEVEVEKETLGKEPLEKELGAFKTISETAALLDVPQHVLRFWESRFSQIKPLKLNGGRRYYRPQDIQILTTIKNLLYKQGYTIKGAKKAFHAEKHSTPAYVAPKPNNLPVMEKGQSQLISIRQDLLDLRDSLRNYINK